MTSLADLLTSDEAMKQGFVFWNGKKVYPWFNQTFTRPITVELEILTFDQNIATQYLSFRRGQAQSFYKEKEEPSFQLEAHQRNIGEIFQVDLLPSKKPKSKKLPWFLLVNSWYSNELVGSFNSGDTEHYLTGNAGVLIKQTQNKLEWVVQCNSDLHPTEHAPSFEDLVFRVKMNE